jgi:hypothetical protein
MSDAGCACLFGSPQRKRNGSVSLTRQTPTSSTSPTSSRPCPIRFATTTFARRAREQALVRGQVLAWVRAVQARAVALEPVLEPEARAQAWETVPEPAVRVRAQALVPVALELALAQVSALVQAQEALGRALAPEQVPGLAQALEPEELVRVPERALALVPELVQAPVAPLRRSRRADLR